MIYGIGVDLVTVSRIAKWLEKKDSKKILNRFFHKDEIEAAFFAKTNLALSFSARFAAKEAFAKALGTGLRGIRLKDICVKTNSKGKPELFLYETAKKALDKTAAKKAFVSLSHEKDFAIALVILEL